MNHGSRPCGGRLQAVAAGFLAAALAAGCGARAPRADPAGEWRLSRDIYDCLYASRRPISDAITSGRVQRGKYNACMGARGWPRATQVLPAVGTEG